LVPDAGVSAADGLDADGSNRTQYTDCQVRNARLIAAFRDLIKAAYLAVNPAPPPEDESAAGKTSNP